MSAVSGKVCAVTGAGSGIGRALALRLARRGARLALADRDAAGLEVTAGAVRDAGADVQTQALDVSDRDAVVAWAGAVATQFGVVHQIYNNAGIAFSRTVEASEWADYERVLGVNLWGVIHGTKAFLPHVIASGDGHVVNVSSLNGYLAQQQMSHYVTSKFAVRGFTETLRVEMLAAGHRVGVTVVHPGGIKTSIADNALEEARRLGLPLTAADEARRRFYNDKLLRMDPAEAAEIIVKGVEAGRSRVRVGSDAKVVDLLVRALPSLHPRLVVAFDKRLRR
ncbi:Putative oxidoreductase SadH [Baekduia alba]|uniref:SDR family NAD(P)-dependent oxidoreductase n=1 Tax=Baekduia alba TaxID=2997333 RepID=UPI0023412215|nr:SDR family NAD(P)-dependent oxidoreductase [Baekduia alba]WCB93467.1 Putative oxidoreductase SadH [Baekduia alba]